jgi:hypothetical protein
VFAGSGAAKGRRDGNLGLVEVGHIVDKGEHFAGVNEAEGRMEGCRMQENSGVLPIFSCILPPSFLLRMGETKFLNC